jgi:uncharacterized protein (UPF0276 family)
MIAAGEVDFCEVMLDNVVHLCPKKVRAVFPATPVCFHIVSSRFLEKDTTALSLMAEHIKPWLDEFEPFYISDHLLFFSVNGRYQSIPREPDYAAYFDLICEKVSEWQRMLGMPLLLENNASTTERGKEQAAWFQRILQQTQADLLFDVSNAYLSELNQVAAFDSWVPLLQKTKHFHVAGYRFDNESQRWHDTHDAPISLEVHACMQRTMSAEFNKTIVVEFDSMIDEKMLQAELVSVRQTVGCKR